MTEPTAPLMQPLVNVTGRRFGFGALTLWSLVFLLIQLTFGLIAGGLLAWLPDGKDAVYAFMLAANPLSVGLTLLWAQARHRFLHWSELVQSPALPGRVWGASLAAFAGVILTTALSSEVWMRLLPADWVQASLSEYNALFAQFPLWSKLVFGVLLAPLAEELLFRGFLTRGLVGSARRLWPALIVTSLLFGGVHLNLIQVVNASLLALGMAWIFVRTGHFWLAVLAHLVNNAVAFLAPVLLGDEFTPQVPGPWSDLLLPENFFVYLAGLLALGWGIWALRRWTPAWQPRSVTPEPPEDAPSPEAGAP